MEEIVKYAKDRFVYYLNTDYGLFVILILLAILIILGIVSYFGVKSLALVKDQVATTIKEFQEKKGNDAKVEVITEKIIESVTNKLENPKFIFRGKKLFLLVLRTDAASKYVSYLVKKVWKKATGIDLK
jgi:hypothetical protein|uniref:Uncharacterized protein n=1 Tax=Myoviridae sp. ctkfK18 TaxID=2825165 RepID=A0A8S5VGE4_9CAUD|nr:MAG TPA: hypothetical protein [Myoviridae sp. ctkfK18]